MSSSFDRRVLTRVKTSSAQDAIIVSGVSGRFPSSANMNEFADNLYNKVDMVDDDEVRWKHINPEISRRSGKVQRIEKFDASFFSVHHRQANLMDAQCRMLMEHSYEAILDAGINPKDMRGSRTGVFIGCVTVDVEEVLIYGKLNRDGLGFTGATRSFLANRISFALGLRGPSFVIDSACSSSLYALDCAFNAMRNGECDAAIVGGTNLLLHPNVTLLYGRLGVLSSDGFCRSFDNNGSGFVRSEAISVIFLQKAVDAKRIYATVVYSKTSNDGFKKENITFPSGQMQIQLLREFYDDLQMDPSDVDYVEAHSPGTKVGDPEECNTLDEIFCKGRNGRPLPVGSVKSNMGHGEASSAICSIAKVLIAFENNKIPPNIHFVEPRADIPALMSGRLEVVDEAKELPGPNVCMNSFGFGGTNAHALFKGSEKIKVNGGIPLDNLPRLVTWSGRTEEAVNVVLDSVAKKPLDAEYVGLLQNTQVTSVSANIYRGYGIFTQTEKSNARCIGKSVQHFDGYKRPVVWVYSGMGSQWCEMGSDLMKIPVFARSIEHCHEILSLQCGMNLKDIITSWDPKTFDNILVSFVGIAAIQIGLTDVLKSLGMSPDHIIGHSFGELGCAYADDCMTAEEMILSAYSRGMASNETKTIFGSMAAVGLGYKKLRAMLTEGIEIACHNNAESCTISGPAEKVALFVADMRKQNYFAKEVQVSNIAYHSSHISEMGPKLLARLTEVLKHPKKRTEKWISSSVPKMNWGTIEAQYSSAQYHTANLLNPVLFEEAAEMLPQDSLVIEIAPSGLMQALLKASLPEAVNIALTKKSDEENLNFMINAIGKIFENGVDMDISKLYPPIEFPVSRGTPMISPLIKWDHREDFHVVRYESNAAMKSERSYTVNISDPEFDFITGHNIDGRTFFPAAGYIYLAWCAAADMARVMLEKCDVEFENVKFLRATVLEKNQDVDFTVCVQKGTGDFQINNGAHVIVTGIVKTLASKLSKIEPMATQCTMLPSGDFYKELRLRGYRYQGLFRSVESARVDGRGGKVRWAANWIAFLDCLLQIQIIGTDSRSLMLPTGIRKVVIKPQDHQAILEAISDEVKILEVKTSSNLSLLSCGGVEIRELKANSVSRRRSPNKPVLETYEFIPHMATSKLSKLNTARFCVQIALENVPHAKVLIVEIDAGDDMEPLIDYFGQALNDFPLVTGDLNFLSNRLVELGSKRIQDGSLKNFNNVTFIIKFNALSDSDFLEKASISLEDGGLLVSRDVTDDTSKLSNRFKVIAIIQSDGEFISLLQHFKVKPPNPTQVIRITSDHFDWIEELKLAVQNGATIAYSEKDEFSGIIGLVNCIRREPKGLNLKCFFIDDPLAPLFDIDHQIYKSQIDQGLAINVFRSGKWGSYRHLLLQQEPKTSTRADHCYADSLVRGDLSSMTWLEGPINPARKFKNLCKLQYASLNFRDVMLATGKLSSEVIGSNRLDQLCNLGLEYSGVTEDGKRIMGIAKSGALATYIKADPNLIWDVPGAWTLAEAATVPVVYATVYSAFFQAIQIERGKSILIHAGSGGVGLAALYVAFAYDLNVFTTVSTEEKKIYLLTEFPKLKQENVGNSRDLSFEDMILERTGGQGVDYVLNSLAGDKLHASIRCLGQGGKFLEIGKFDLANNTKIGLETFLKGLSFHSVLVEKIFTARTKDKNVIRNLLVDDINRGIIVPIKTNVFEANDIEQAFRFLASGKHMGKVILKVREDPLDVLSLPLSVSTRVYCNSDFSYIIAGGLGGFGLELADWLVLRGCRKLVLSSRQGIREPYQAYRIKTWETYGVEVVVSTSDITSKAGCEDLLRASILLGPVGGIFNLAVILRDRIFENQDKEQFIDCFAPKAKATFYLDELSRVLCPKLQYFVVFSSLVCGRGNAGQSNYGMANSVMERIMEQRQIVGLPAKAIQWGAVGDVGVLADLQEDAEIGGTLPQRISSCLEELDRLITDKAPLVASMVVSRKMLLSTGGKANILDAIMNIMSIRDVKSLSMETTLSELGMDSLMMIEIQQTLEREYDMLFSAQELRSMTLAQLVKSASRDSKELTDQNILNGMEMLLQNYGDESNSEKTILKLESLSEEGVKLLIVPGIEGMAGKAWRIVARSLNCPTYVLQCAKTWESCDLDSTYAGVIQDVLNLFSNDEKFIIMGYSFGALLGLKLASTLESMHKPGQLVLLDSSPKFLKTLTADLLPENCNDEIIQTMVLTNTIATIFSGCASNTLRVVLAEKSWRKRTSKLMEILKGGKPFSDEYGILFLNSFVNRVKLVQNLDINRISKLKSTPMTLLRPTEATILNIEEDYGLNRYTEMKVAIKFMEGNHVTILDNPKLYKFINSLV